MMNQSIQRELRVAFSKKAQPVWFRIVKWALFLGVSLVLWRTAYFGWWIGGLMVAAMAVHFTWRWKTRGWTQPWGGWSDVEAAKSK